MENIIWPERCTAGQVKPAMWAATAKISARSMWQLLKKVRHFIETISLFPGGKHGQAKV